MFAPDYLGKMDVLIAGGKILAVEEQLEGGYEGVEVEELSGEGKVLTPGFIDCHFHILGGGGEGGYQNRTPEVTLSQLTTAGVTTVVGCLGTDGEGRDMTALISKAKGLEAEGISTYVYEGSYRLPVKTVTDSIIKDFLTIDKIIGIGEIAVSDHRSSQPSFEEFARAAADARVGGMLSGKAGIINVHLGGGKRKLELLTLNCRRNRNSDHTVFALLMRIVHQNYLKLAWHLLNVAARLTSPLAKILIFGRRQMGKCASVKH